MGCDDQAMISDHGSLSVSSLLYLAQWFGFRSSLTVASQCRVGSLRCSTRRFRGNALRVKGLDRSLRSRNPCRKSNGSIILYNLLTPRLRLALHSFRTPIYLIFSLRPITPLAFAEPGRSSKDLPSTRRALMFWIQWPFSGSNRVQGTGWLRDN